MKMWIKVLLVIMPLFMVVGCEPFFTEDDEPEYSFINKSDFRVYVIPQANSGWDGFSLAPGERRKIYDVIDVFFTYQPEFRVTVGVNEGDRIVFINNAGATEASQ